MGETHVRTVNGVTEHWCGQCTDWKHDHGTDTNCDKCSTYKPKSKTSRARVAAAGAQYQAVQDSANANSGTSQQSQGADILGQLQLL
eukprot:15334703-Ditylum_brightwellii.AAC.1